MGYARGLLQEVAVIAASPLSAPSPSDVVNQHVTPGGVTPSDSSSTGPFYVNSHFSPTMIIILVILLSSFFFMGLFAVYVRRCTSEEGVSQRGTSGRMARRGELIVGSGVDPLLVERYPMVSYAVAKKKGCNECSVCLGDFEGGDELKQLPKCKHVFHPGCIGLWLESHTTCPICRRSLVNSDRWSISFRWGGSSRGVSISTRRNGEESRRSTRRGSSRRGRAGSSRGWFVRNNDDASFGGGAQHEMSVRDASELESQRGLPTSPPSSSQHGLPVSSLLSEVAPRGLPDRPLSSELAPLGHAESVLSNLSPHGIQASNLMQLEIQECSELMPRGNQSSELAASELQISSKLATNASSELAIGESRKPRQTAALEGRRKLSRSNSTGHSLRRRAAMGCMPFSLHRSRSVGLDGLDEEEAMACATSENAPLSGSSCSSQNPHEPSHFSTSASAPL